MATTRRTSATGKRAGAGARKRAEPQRSRALTRVVKYNIDLSQVVSIKLTFPAHLPAQRMRLAAAEPEARVYQADVMMSGPVVPVPHPNVMLEIETLE